MELKVLKQSLRLTQAEAARIVVDDAIRKAKALVMKESRCAGDYSAAMARATRRHGLPKSFLWSLHYRPPKDVASSVWVKLIAAYRAECQRQMGKLLDEATEVAGTDPDLARQALSLVGLNLQALDARNQEEIVDAEQSGNIDGAPTARRSAERH